MRNGSKSDLNKKVKKKINILHVFTILFFVYFVYAIFDQQIQINKYESQIQMYGEDIENTDKLAKYYSEQKSNISSDEYIESVARDRLRICKAKRENIYRCK